MNNANQDKKISAERRKGRGSRSNISGRYEKQQYEDFDDNWGSLEDLPVLKTSVQHEVVKKILTTNQSPDIPFDQSINPYRGCEHGCPYCFARPTHAYMGLSPGLDFESKLYAKTNAAECLLKELANPRYKIKTIALGTNTDPYQPIERDYKITRSILDICNQTNHPVTIVTKSALICRDLDILSELAEKELVRVALSVTTLDKELARSMEPRASTPFKRIEAQKKLYHANIPTISMMAPIIPSLNDPEIENILEHVKAAGVLTAYYVLLRLPLELKEIFEEWLETDFPNRRTRIFSLIKSMRKGKLYEAKWGERMRGTGPYADLIDQRFRLAKTRLGLTKQLPPLRTDLFQPPSLDNQLRLL